MRTESPNGVIEASKRSRHRVYPWWSASRGTNAEEGRKILLEIGIEGGRGRRIFGKPRKKIVAMKGKKKKKRGETSLLFGFWSRWNAVRKGFAHEHFGQ